MPPCAVPTSTFSRRRCQGLRVGISHHAGRWGCARSRGDGSYNGDALGSNLTGGSRPGSRWDIPGGKSGLHGQGAR